MRLIIGQSILNVRKSGEKPKIARSKNNIFLHRKNNISHTPGLHQTRGCGTILPILVMYHPAQNYSESA